MYVPLDLYMPVCKIKLTKHSYNLSTVLSHVGSPAVAEKDFGDVLNIGAVHAEGTIPIKLSLNGRPVGSRQLTYYSMSGDVVAGLSQIYLQQLVPLLDVVLLSPSGPLCPPSDVDRLLIQLFEDEDEDSSSSSAQQIPSQAFEQLFGMYSQTVSGMSSVHRTRFIKYFVYYVSNKTVASSA